VTAGEVGEAAQGACGGGGVAEGVRGAGGLPAHERVLLVQGEEALEGEVGAAVIEVEHRAGEVRAHLLDPAAEVFGVVLEDQVEAVGQLHLVLGGEVVPQGDPQRASGEAERVHGRPPSRLLLAPALLGGGPGCPQLPDPAACPAEILGHVRAGEALGELQVLGGAVLVVGLGPADGVLEVHPAQGVLGLARDRPGLGAVQAAHLVPRLGPVPGL